MKFIHLGDLHLGKTLHEFDLIEDQKYILDRILELADMDSVDGVHSERGGYAASGLFSGGTVQAGHPCVSRERQP